MKNRPAIAVSGLHRGENPQPGAAVIASLRRRFPGLRLVGLSYDPLESGLYGQGADHADIAYLIPYPGVGTRALLEQSFARTFVFRPVADSHRTFSVKMRRSSF